MSFNGSCTSRGRKDRRGRMYLSIVGAGASAGEGEPDYMCICSYVNPNPLLHLFSLCIPHSVREIKLPGTTHGNLSSVNSKFIMLSSLHSDCGIKAKITRKNS